MSTTRLKFAFEPIIGGVWGDEPKGDPHDMVCVRVADFDDQAGEVSTEKLTMRNISPSEQKGRVLQRGDLLLEKSGGGEQTSVGRSVRFDHDFTAVSSNFIALLRPRDGHDANFLTYLMRALYQGGGSIPHIKQTTGIQNLDCDSYLSRAFNFPSAADERLIAGYLDEATGRVDRLVALRLRQMELLQEQRAARIQKAVTRGLSANAPLKDSGVPWIGRMPRDWQLLPLRAVLTERGEFNTDLRTNKFLSVLKDVGVVPYEERESSGNKKSDEMEKYKIIHPGDIVANRMNLIFGSVGRSAHYGCSSTEYYVLRGRNDSVDTRFFGLIFQSKGFQRSLVGIGSGILAHRMRIYYEELKKVLLPAPPIQQQHEVVEFVEHENARFDRLHSTYARQLELLTEYRAALIHECVTGQRRL